MCTEDCCKFQKLGYFGIRWQDLYLLQRTKASNDCEYIPKWIRGIPQPISHGLPSIRFGRLDHLSKRRFYSICFPVQRKRLWNCSRACSNLGKKPTTLVVGAITNGACFPFESKSSKDICKFFHFDEAKVAVICTKTKQVVMDNLVLNLTGDFNLQLNFARVQKMMKYVEFNHFKINFDCYEDWEKHISYLFSPKVTTIRCLNLHEEFNKVIDLLPNIRELSLCFTHLGFFLEKFNRDFGSQLSSIGFTNSNDWNCNLLADFLQKQSGNVWLSFKCRDRDIVKAVLPYFEPVHSAASDKKGLIIRFRRINYYFVLRDSPDIPAKDYQ